MHVLNKNWCKIGKWVWAFGVISKLFYNAKIYVSFGNVVLIVDSSSTEIELGHKIDSKKTRHLG